MFDTFLVQPIFNLLVLIYALLPGHNFGLAIIIFTVIIRLLLWPLVKKQLHQAKLMRRIRPDLKRIAKETKGNRQKQSQMQMELYKEKGISPFGTIGVALLQLPVLIALYIGLQRVIKDPHEMVDFAYPVLQNLGWMQQLQDNIKLFDSSLFGIVDLGRAAIGPQGLYIPALILVLASAVTQYFQAKQLMPNDKDARGLRSILRDAGAGKQADQSELSDAVGRSTRFILPVMIFFFTVNIPSALGLYWFVGGLVAFIQQSIVLRDDSQEMTELAGSTQPGKNSDGRQQAKSSKDATDIPEAELVVTTPSKAERKAAKAASKSAAAPELETIGAASGSSEKTFKQKPGSTVTSVTRSKKRRRR